MMKSIRTCMGIVCAVLFVLGSSGEFFPISASSLDEESQQLETDFLERYKTLYDAGMTLKEEIRGLRPLSDEALSEEEMLSFWTMIEELYAEYPKYKDKDSQKDEADDIARITGLPEKELARYQQAKGTLGLQKLTLSVNTHTYEEWLRLYFRLIEIPEKIEDFSEIPARQNADDPLEQARTAFYEAGQAYTASRDALLARLDELIPAEEVLEMKTQLALYKQKYLVLDNNAARIDRFGELGYTDWFKEYEPERSKFSAFLAGTLRVNFADLAYIEKKSGRYGLEKFLKQCEWLDNMEELIEELKEL